MRAPRPVLGEAMNRAAIKPSRQGRALPKAATGIQRLDEIAGGGLPRGCPTLVSGGAGCGKTLLGMEFLVRGATEFGGPGIFMDCEETAEELTQNVRSLGFDLDQLSQEQIAASVMQQRDEMARSRQADDAAATAGVRSRRMRSTGERK
jgi:KaiC/GvpD/RAD55 family RecA-like ATPase